MQEATFTFRVDERLKSAFAEAAKACDRTGAQLLRDFMRDYVSNQQSTAEYDKWFHEEVAAGLRSVKAGRLVAAEDVEATFLARREKTRKALKKA